MDLLGELEEAWKEVKALGSPEQKKMTINQIPGTNPFPNE